MPQARAGQPRTSPSSHSALSLAPRGAAARGRRPTAALATRLNGTYRPRLRPLRLIGARRTSGRVADVPQVDVTKSVTDRQGPPAWACRRASRGLIRRRRHRSPCSCYCHSPGCAKPVIEGVAAGRACAGRLGQSVAVFPGAGPGLPGGNGWPTGPADTFRMITTSTIAAAAAKAALSLVPPKLRL